MKLKRLSLPLVQRVLLQWFGLVVAFIAITVAAVFITLLAVRLSPVLRGVDPPSSTVITAVPQQLRLSEYTVIQELHSKKTQQRRLLEGFLVYPFDPL